MITMTSLSAPKFMTQQKTEMAPTTIATLNSNIPQIISTATCLMPQVIERISEDSEVDIEVKKYVQFYLVLMAFCFLTQEIRASRCRGK